MTALQTAYDYFIGQGASPAAAQGIAGGLYAESGLNPSAFNSGGGGNGAYGIGQFRAGRQAALFAEFGSSPTLLQQLQFVWQELTGTAGSGDPGTHGASSILSASSSNDALSNFINYFEIPGPNSSAAVAGDISRGIRAIAQIDTSGSNGLVTPQVVGSNGQLNPFQVGVQTLATNPGLFFGTLFGGAVTPQDIVTNGITTSAQLAGQGANQVTGNIAGAVAAGVGAAVNPLTSWFSGLTSSDTVSRVSIGIVAVILLAAGIFFLAGNKTTTINLASLKGAT